MIAGLVIRPVDLAVDRAAMLAVDTSFTTALVFALDRGPRGLALVEQALAEPIRKTFPLDDLDDPERPWSVALAAEAGGRLIGFVASEFRPWNRRTVIWHLYVDTPSRGQGVARALLEAAEADARAQGARSLWLETSNLNLPGVRAYERLGFTLSGIDASLYQATPAEAEFALFLERPIPPNV